MQEKYLDNLQKAVKSLQIADHITYITYPMIKDKRLLLRALEGISEAIISIINAILQYECLFRRIRLYAEAKQNFQLFIRRCAPIYNINSKEIEEIIFFLTITEKHQKSPLEFTRQDKLVIMSENLKPTVIDIEQIKKAIITTKGILEKAKLKIIKK